MLRKLFDFNYQQLMAQVYFFTDMALNALIWT